MGLLTPMATAICVLGGCGTIGRVIVNCLLQYKRRLHITIADLHIPRVALPKQTHFVKVDLHNHSLLVHLLRKHALVINSTSHHFNLQVMSAALEAGTHYLDLGGLFHFTRRQLKLNDAFHKKNLTAILGMGCAPGISNLLACWAAEGMDSVKEIHIKVGSQSWGPSSETLPYAIRTIQEELTLKPVIYHHGRWLYQKPRSGVEWIDFPNPVGRQKIFRTLHSETATLPLSFSGLKEASFKIGFSNDMIRTVLKPGKGRKPKASSQQDSHILPRDCEITAAFTFGRLHGNLIKRVAYCKVLSSGYHSAGDLDTAWPAAIVSWMLVSNQIQKRGVFPPETGVSFQLLFQELQKMGFRFVRQRLS